MSNKCYSCLQYRGRLSATAFFVAVLCSNLGAVDFPGNCGALCVYLAASSEGADLPTYDRFVKSHSWAQQPLCSLENQLIALQSLGVDAQIVQWPAKTPPKGFHKVIAHQDVDHFVIIKNNTASSELLLFDPPKSERPLAASDWASFSGLGIEFGNSQPSYVDAGVSWWRALAVALCVVLVCSCFRKAYAGRFKRVGRAGAIDRATLVGVGLIGIAAVGMLGYADPGWLVRDFDRQVKTQTPLPPRGLHLQHAKFEKPLYEIGEIAASSDPYRVMVTVYGAGRDSAQTIARFSTSCGCMAAKISTVENYHCEVELALSRRDAGKNTVDVAAHLSGSDRVIRSTVTYDVITQLDAFAVPAHHEAVDITGKLVSHVVVDSESDLPKPLRLECELTDVQVQNGVNVTQVWHSQNSCELQIDIGNSSGFHVVHFGLLAPSGKRLHELIPVSWETPERLAVSPKQVVVQAKTDVIRFLVERPEVLRNSEEWIVEFDGKQIWEFGWQPLGDGAGRLEIPMPKSNSVSAHGSHALQITLKQETVTVPVTILKGDK